MKIFHICGSGIQQTLSINACSLFYNTLSRLTVVSRTAKQSRTGDTTVCYIHERSILIEYSPKADYKNQSYEKTMHNTKSV